MIVQAFDTISRNEIHNLTNVKVDNRNLIIRTGDEYTDEDYYQVFYTGNDSGNNSVMLYQGKNRKEAQAAFSAACVILQKIY